MPDTITVFLYFGHSPWRINILVMILQDSQENGLLAMVHEQNSSELDIDSLYLFLMQILVSFVQCA